MSVSDTVDVKCPVCGHTQGHEVWGTIDVTDDPDLKRRLIDFELTTFVCEQCEETTGLEQDLLYEDRNVHLMVCRLPEGELDAQVLEEALSLRNVLEPGENICRVVSSTNELIEKILIFDDGLDDRVIELFKLVIWNNLAEEEKGEDAELFYGGMGQSEEDESQEVIEFLLLDEEGLLTISVPLGEEYRPTEAFLLEQLPALDLERGQWLVVDRQFAESLIDEGDDEETGEQE